MRNDSDKRSITGKLARALLIAAMLCFPGSALLVNAQNDSVPPAPADSTAIEQPAAEEEAAPELISPAMQFVAIQKGDGSTDLKVKLSSKVKGWVYNLYKMKISFYRVVDGEDQELGYAITDGAGKAVFNVKGDSLSADAEGKLNFKAAFAGNKAMEPAEGLVSFKKAKLEIIPVKEDSVLSVQVKLTEAGSAGETPVKDATIGIYVKRLFLPQKVGEGTTDETGMATVEFPNGLPGDTKGNLTLIAKIDENEIYGNLETSSEQGWGVPVSDKLKGQPRSLWSSNPPLWMLITFIVLMVAVWGHYIVIIYELFRLRKEQPHTPAGATNP